MMEWDDKLAVEARKIASSVIAESGAEVYRQPIERGEWDGDDHVIIAMRTLMQERIVAAAIRVDVPDELREKMWNGKRVYPDTLTVSAPPPARHHTLLHPMCELLGHGIGPDDQGFLTSKGRYVGREEALKIAKDAGQPMIDHPALNAAGMLFSEDLW